MTLVGLDGHVYVRLKMRLDSDSQLLPGAVVLRSPKNGRRYMLDPSRSRLVAYRRGRPHRVIRDARGCETFVRRGQQRFMLCPASPRDVGEAIAIKVESTGVTRAVAGIPPHGRPPPFHAGSWYEAYLSPDGGTVLALWSAECEVPTAFFVSTRSGRMRAVSGERDWRKAPESIPLGWSEAGWAAVDFLGGGCGNGYKVPGVYLIEPRTGKHRLVLGTQDSWAVMWRD